MSNLEIFSNQDFVKIFTSTNAHVVDFMLFDTIDALPDLGITLSIGPYSLVNRFYCAFHYKLPWCSGYVTRLVNQGSQVRSRASPVRRMGL